MVIGLFISLYNLHEAKKYQNHSICITSAFIRDVMNPTHSSSPMPCSAPSNHQSEVQGLSKYHELKEKRIVTVTIYQALLASFDERP